jgi:hypothetical protein
MSYSAEMRLGIESLAQSLTGVDLSIDRLEVKGASHEWSIAFSGSELQRVFRPNGLQTCISQKPIRNLWAGYS